MPSPISSSNYSSPLSPKPPSLSSRNSSTTDKVKRLASYLFRSIGEPSPRIKWTFILILSIAAISYVVYKYLSLASSSRIPSSQNEDQEPTKPSNEQKGKKPNKQKGKNGPSLLDPPKENDGQEKLEASNTDEKLLAQQPKEEEEEELGASKIDEKLLAQQPKAPIDPNINNNNNDENDNETQLNGDASQDKKPKEEEEPEATKIDPNINNKDENDNETQLSGGASQGKPPAQEPKKEDDEKKQYEVKPIAEDDEKQPS